jgi:hypothetical protein
MAKVSRPRNVVLKDAVALIRSVLLDNQVTAESDSRSRQPLVFAKEKPETKANSLR